MATTPRSEMRILTVRQPWAWAIIHGGKDVENRVRNIAGDYRGPIAIHAGLLWDTAADSWDAHTFSLHAAMDRVRGEIRGDAFPWSEFGAIIGVVDLVDVHLCSGSCSPWAEGPVDLGGGLRDMWHLVLANPRALDEPIPYKGALGLRRLDDEIAARIEAAFA